MHSSSTGIEVNPVAAIPSIAALPNASSSQQEAGSNLAGSVLESKENKVEKPGAESKHVALPHSTTHLTHSFQDQAWHDLLVQLRQSAPVKQQHIFISYAWERGEANHKLQKKLKQIEQDLEAMGFDVFLDVSDMDKDITKTMEEGVKTADVVLPILTRRFGARVGEVMDEQGQSLRDNNLQFEFAHTYSKIINSKNDHAVIPLRFASLVSQSTNHCYVLNAEPTPETLTILTEQQAIAFYRDAGGDWYLVAPSKHGGALKENLQILIKDNTKRHAIMAQLADMLTHVQAEQAYPVQVEEIKQVNIPAVAEEGGNAENAVPLVSAAHLLDLQQSALTRAEDISTACAIASLCGANTSQDLDELSSIFRVPAIDFSQSDNAQSFRQSLLRLVALLRPHETLNLQAWYVACLHNAPLTNPFVTGRTEEIAQLTAAIEAHESQSSQSSLASSSSPATYYSISGPKGIGKTTLVQYYAQQRGLSFVHRVPADVAYSADAARSYVATLLDVSLDTLDQALANLPRGVFLFEDLEPLKDLATGCWGHHLTFVTHTTEAASTLHLGALTPGATFTYLSHQLPQVSFADRETLAKALHYDPGLLTQASYLITHSVGLNVATYLEIYSDTRLVNYAQGQSGLPASSGPSAEHKLDRGQGDLSARAWDNLLVDINAIDPQTQPRIQLLFTATDEKEHGVFLQQLQSDLSRAGVSCTVNREALSANVLVPILTPAFLKEAGDPNSAIAQRLTEAGLYKQAGVDEEKQATTLAPISLARIEEVLKGPLAPLGNQLIRLCTTQADYQKLLVGLSNPKGLLLSLYDYTNNHPALKQALDRWHLSTLTQLPPLPTKFCGRAQELSQLTSHFTQHNQLTISSLGGMGKSQLAMVFAHRSEGYAFIRWLSADAERLDRSFRALAEDLGIAIQGLSPAEIIQAVHDKLETLPQGLLILDNVPDAKIIEDYLPKSQRHHILITSRSHAWDHCLKLDAFSEADAQAYLTSQLPMANVEDCVKLTKALGALPLALDQAAAYIQTHQCTIEAYLTQYAAQNADANDSVYASWRLSIEAIQAVCPLAVELLYYCAYLQPDAMPFDLLEKILDMPLFTLHHELMGILSQYSLIGSHAAGHINVHRLVQAALRAQDKTQAERLVKITDILLDRFPEDVANHGDVMRQQQLMPHMRALIEQLDALSNSAFNGNDRADAFSLLCTKLGAALQAQGNLAEAISLLQQALASYIKTYGEDHPSVVAGRSHLAVALTDQGHLAQAIPLFQQALASGIKTYGEDHPAVARGRANLASALKDQGNLNDAIPLLQQALASYIKTYGEDHPNVARGRNNLAMALQGQGNLNDAIPLFQQALASDLKTYGEDHPTVARGRNNLAMALQGQGNLNDAISLLQQALASYIKTYGEDHPSVVAGRSHLAVALTDQGHLAQAIPLFQQALASGIKTYGEDHPAVVGGRILLANALQAQGNLNDAIPLFRQALASDIKAYGEDHPTVAIRRSNLALALQAQGNLNDAIPLFRQALASCIKTYGEDHPDVARGRNNLAMALKAQVNVAEAIPLYQQALTSSIKIYGEDHLDVARGRNNLAGALQAQGNLNDAIPLFRQALASNIKAYGEDHPTVVGGRILLANGLQAQGNLNDAIPLFRQALASNIKAYGEDHPTVVGGRILLANALQAQGNLNDAIPLFRQALASDIKAYGEDHPTVAIRRSNLALALQAQGNLNDAIPLFRQALASCIKTYGEDHPDVARGRNNLAMALKAQGNVAEAIPLLQQALASGIKTYGEDHPDVATSRSNLAMVLLGQGNLKDAILLFQQALASDIKTYGEDHPDVVTYRNSLAMVLLGQGNFKDAIPLFQQALASDIKTYGEDHPKVATGRSHLVLALQAQGNLKDAIPLFQQALASDIKAYGEDHPTVAMRRNNLAMSLKAQGNLKDAIPLFQQALASGIKTYGEDHPNVATMRSNLAGALKAQGNLSPSSHALKTAGFFAEFGQREEKDPPEKPVFGGFFDNQKLSLEILVKKYKLPDQSQNSLEKGLRNAAVNGCLADLKIFAQYVKNLNAQDTDPESRKTAAHWAAVKGHEDCYNFLVLEKKVHTNIPDASNKTAASYHISDPRKNLNPFWTNRKVAVAVAGTAVVIAVAASQCTIL